MRTFSLVDWACSPGGDEKGVVADEGGIIQQQSTEGVPLGGRDQASLDELSTAGCVERGHALLNAFESTVTPLPAARNSVDRFCGLLAIIMPGLVPSTGGCIRQPVRAGWSSGGGSADSRRVAARHTGSVDPSSLGRLDSEQ